MASISFYTLGCKSNRYETGEIARDARRQGYEIVDFNSPADVYIINTCTVTQLADKKSRRAIRQAKKRNPNAKVIVTGCYAEVSPEEIKKMPEADLIIKNSDKKKVLKCLGVKNNSYGLPALPAGRRVACSTPPRVRENLMIEDGCEEFCKYCIVPYARGKVKSKPVERVIEEAKNLVCAGAKEIVLTGINLGAYGLDESKNSKFEIRDSGLEIGNSLPRLLKELTSIDSLLRIRLSSIEPMYVTDELIEAIKANPKVCKHLHIPLQSGSTKVLKLMGRKYPAVQFKALIKRMRLKIKGVALNTDIIVGYPGESEKDFKDTMKLVKDLKFSRVHVFHFSPRPGTAGATMPDRIDPAIITARANKMRALRSNLMRNFAREAMRTPQEVLVESRDKKTGLLEGLTESYIRVLFKGRDSLIGKLVKVRIKGVRDEHAVGGLL